MNKNTTKLYKKLIILNGAHAQEIKAMEEMAELTQALCKPLCGNGRNIDNICEEITDVKIMVEQLELIYKGQKDRIDSCRDMKLNRIKEIIENGSDKKCL